MGAAGGPPCSPLALASLAWGVGEGGRLVVVVERIPPRGWRNDACTTTAP